MMMNMAQLFMMTSVAATGFCSLASATVLYFYLSSIFI